MYMKLKDGKSKVLTLSYDDGVVQDIRLIGILNQYGIKATFNINTGLYVPEETQRERYYGRMKLSEAKEIYTDSGHEVAVHALTHPFLERLKSAQVLTEILEDRKNIESQYGTLARGMAYPYGTYNDRTVEILAEENVRYSRTCIQTEGFEVPVDLLRLPTTCRHANSNLLTLAREFVELKPDKPQLFYLWGHSYEFDEFRNWELIEEFCKIVSGHDDTYYGTNSEVLLGVSQV